VTDTPASPATPVACARCGAVAPGAGDPPFTWSTEIEDGRRTHTCEACARAALRSIEAKLDQQWW
jgi:hypothetical protein